MCSAYELVLRPKTVGLEDLKKHEPMPIHANMMYFGPVHMVPIVVPIVGSLMSTFKIELPHGSHVKQT